MEVKIYLEKLKKNTGILFLFIKEFLKLLSKDKLHCIYALTGYTTFCFFVSARVIVT